MNKQDLCALVDACLDDGMTFTQIVKCVRSEEYLPIRNAVNLVVRALEESAHNRAPESLEQWRRIEIA